MFDLIIRNGTVIDGTGNAGFLSDVAVRGGKIASVGSSLSGAARYIDATGLMVCPGFIDSHNHSDMSVLSEHDQRKAAEQGITFAITGQCGGSAAPSTLPGQCGTMKDFMEQLDQTPLDTNFAILAGHGTLRAKVCGRENRPVTGSELKQMGLLLEDCLKSGAIGMSLGLTYTPGSYADTRELTALAKIVACYGGVVAAHIRNESDRLLESVEEFITILKSAGCTGVISHHKAADKANWGKVKEALAMVEQAAAEGVDIYADAYPYCASMTSLLARFVPRQFHPEGTKSVVKLLDDPVICEKVKTWATGKWGTDLSWVLVTNCAKRPEFVGKTMNEIAHMMGISDRYEAVFALLRETEGKCQACFTMMCEEDVKYVLAHPRVMIGTDSDMGKPGKQHHPRRAGTFPRVLGRYVRQEQLVSLPEMIRKMTGLPAQVYDLPGKGRIAEGYDADICIFDPENILDRADYANCSLSNEGLHYVLIDGKVVVENNRYNGTRAGKMFMGMATHTPRG